MIDSVLDANGLSVEDAIDQLGTVCADFLLSCNFAGKKFQCMQVGKPSTSFAQLFTKICFDFQTHKYMTFVESYSYLGACCSFNYNPKAFGQDELFNVNSFGANGGLNVIGTGRPQASDGKSGAVYSEGFVVLVHHSNDFAVESAPTTYLPLSSETFVDVQPIHSSCSDQVLGLPFSQRKCIIPPDIQASHYRQPACMLSCLRTEIHKRCGCHPFHLPKSDNETRFIRDCKAKDVYCFVLNYCENFDVLI